ncbi:MAG: DNA modification methylase [Marine Group III euryarchaeote CG-Epi2]|uniref:site-specific DNA-methyltransferase (cytosine-N(4)-specific) n=1 Tax=Marine Group III euryarchaeote CG-Epi2 TaxID=1888996 RepID=A0A1J5UCE7_9ARCH|nr:MAG: DNA modification methylase [Marine Group III euryarchaeote CG-Epi2]
MSAVSIEKVNSKLLNFNTSDKRTELDRVTIGSKNYKRFINEFWTAKQRQANNLHEISYRACYKPQLPKFFIDLFTKSGDIVYDPFAGRGTTLIEAAILNRNIISNDINPLSRILTEPRLNIPTIQQIEERLNQIQFKDSNADINLSMFYHKDTESEIVCLRNELDSSNFIDNWIKMVCTTRLTGHSAGFFSGYTLPPNQATTQKGQVLINQKLGLSPPYKNTKEIILKKSKALQRNLSPSLIQQLFEVGKNAIFSSKDSKNTFHIPNESVRLTVTSPPFLNIVRYASDNWLRCWFNSIDSKQVEKEIVSCRTVSQWSKMMSFVFDELYRVTLPGGWIAFEVGEVNNGKIKLDEAVVPLGLKSGLDCAGIMVNSQDFTKTSNIWGINNMKVGTNTNRIVIFHKPK